MASRLGTARSRRTAELLGGRRAGTGRWLLRLGTEFWLCPHGLGLPHAQAGVTSLILHKRRARHRKFKELS